MIFYAPSVTEKISITRNLLSRLVVAVIIFWKESNLFVLNCGAAGPHHLIATTSGPSRRKRERGFVWIRIGEIWITARAGDRRQNLKVVEPIGHGRLIEIVFECRCKAMNENGSEMVLCGMSAMVSNRCQATTTTS